ncbi:hypothetical protein HNQ50_002821 [Silvimonas terrae]|uniref:Uncharacterized protein n=1 Tax=Silvimonas terrae TaxID=300266 RepID=A0A840RHN3_9NEIS|nr:hypothetical protein [Silvimonas terrae]MBB5192084.1 hypothetical protein [Silvimonas terrae]
MLTQSDELEGFTRAKVLLNLLLAQASAQGQTGMVSHLLELHSFFVATDFMVLQYYRHLLHVAQAVDLLLEHLDSAPDQHLSCEAIKRLLAPFFQHMDEFEAGLGLPS